MPQVSEAPPATTNPELLAQAQPQPQPNPSVPTDQPVPRGANTPNPQHGSAQLRAKLEKMNGDADSALKKFSQLAGVEFRQPASHFDRVKLAHDIAIKLRAKDPAQYEAFLREMENAGKPFGVNFGLSRAEGSARTSLNQKEYDALDDAHRGVNHGLRQDGQPKPTADQSSVTANPVTPVVDSTTVTNDQSVTPAPQANPQARQQIAEAIARLDKDGDRNTLSLDEVRQAMRQEGVGQEMLQLYRELEQHMSTLPGDGKLSVDQLLEWSVQRAARQSPQPAVPVRQA
jgi:hypothetical protein